MFKNIILKIIDKIGAIHERLKIAYNMTYGDVITSRFNNEIEKRREFKRKRLLERIKEFLKSQYHKDTGDFMPDNVAEEFAKEFYITAKMKGEIDDLNNYNGKFDLD